MLISIVERLQSKRGQEHVRYGAWSAARRKLLTDGSLGKLPALSGLRDYLEAVPTDQQ